MSVSQGPAGRSNNLLRIVGVGGGAIGGVCIGIANYERFPIGILLFLVIGALLGGVVARLAAASPKSSASAESDDGSATNDQMPESVSRGNNLRLASGTLGIGLGLGLLAGLLLGGPILVFGPFFGAVVGGAMFLGLMLSGGRR